MLLILGIVLIVAGVYALLQRQLLWGVVLVVAGLIIAPSNFYPGL
ncbi:MAG: GPGG-motif small membrane protein [Nocardiopsaceae bacterium]|nr:GPGG-motif small membrane protein [Nocardiopsaceae bacterium]